MYGWRWGMVSALSSFWLIGSDRWFRKFVRRLDGSWENRQESEGRASIIIVIVIAVAGVVIGKSSCELRRGGFQFKLIYRPPARRETGAGVFLHLFLVRRLALRCSVCACFGDCIYNLLVWVLNVRYSPLHRRDGLRLFVMKVNVPGLGRFEKLIITNHIGVAGNRKDPLSFPSQQVG